MLIYIKGLYITLLTNDRKFTSLKANIISWTQAQNSDTDV